MLPSVDPPVYICDVNDYPGDVCCAGPGSLLSPQPHFLTIHAYTETDVSSLFIEEDQWPPPGPGPQEPPSKLLSHP